MFFRRTLLFLSVLAACASASAQILWDESVNGDLSGDRLNPTNLALAPGINGILATSVSGDREYVHFSVGSGMALSQIILVSWAGNDQIGFIGVQAGNTFTEPPTGTNVANLLGWSHMGPGVGNVGQDILPSIGTGAGSIGFAPPLTGSDYTFWIQQTGTNAVSYRLDFITSPVPEPASLVVLAIGALSLRRRRK